MNIERVVFDAVEQVRLEIQRDLSNKGIDNKKAASNSLHTEQNIQATKFNTELWGEDYLYYLDKGRGPGRFPPLKMIEDWVKTKPVDVNPYLVGRKIALFGTSIWQDRTKGIELDKKIVQMAAKLKPAIEEAMKEDIINNFKIK